MELSTTIAPLVQSGDFAGVGAVVGIAGASLGALWLRWRESRTMRRHTPPVSDSAVGLLPETLRQIEIEAVANLMRAV